MTHVREANREDDAEKDIAHVLDAEQRAREAIARCTQEAAALIADARDRARQIQARTDARMSRLRTRIERQAVDETAVWRERARELHARENDPDPRASRLAAAIARLAAALTGEEP